MRTLITGVAGFIWVVGIDNLGRFAANLKADFR